MNDQMDSYIKWRERDRLPDTPQLVLELGGSPSVWTESRNQNYSVSASLRRIYTGPENPAVSERAAIILYSGGKDNYDRCKVTHQLSFPDTWQKLLQPGYTYSLLWTGQEIANWDWGTQLEVGNKPKWPPVLVPGGAHITFTVNEGERPPIPRPTTPPPISPSERVPGAPVLSLELSCSPTMPLTGSLEISIRVIYHGLPDNNNNITGDEELRPITFHTYAFKPVDGQFRVYRHRCRDQSSLETEEEWETFEGDGYRHQFWDNPDKLINVSENPDGQFPTLFPGESWSDSWTMTADGDGLPDDLKPGERLRYQFKGNTLDWWRLTPRPS
ncbi:uncharacterized protein CDV56_108059 [Aspergillus thermomutatus]|uniref:Uncharacterized protein n=1 Tax=Aspergillus thermomutatus TaxID=41047 RepID=A0A397H895_ASPTH|nr:uncharacterized protein CDV56_108059 [Aspergillus thermomutatus]RHZ59272.1 hypothetical protein CDV56_108059 [Aspergillus thermomutatus]